MERNSPVQEIFIERLQLWISSDATSVSGCLKRLQINELPASEGKLVHSRGDSLTMASKRLSQQQATTGLRVALRIILAWQATPAQACSILRISVSTFHRISQGLDVRRRLDLDQQQRIGIVLSIHTCLRTVFDNPANVKGFPGLTNHNSFFEGRSPLEIMANGDMISLYQTYKRIEQLELG